MTNADDFHQRRTCKASIIVQIDETGIVPISKSLNQYRTEFYLEQREKQTNGSNLTTWKQIVEQKQNLSKDQVEIDRAISTIDAIHESLNRSLIVPHNRLYSSLYSDQDDSHRLIRSFCQRRDHCSNFDENIEEKIKSNSTSNLVDVESIVSDEELDERKAFYDSGYETLLRFRN